MENIIDRITRHYNDLSRVQKNIANYLLKNPQEACFYSLKELSAQTGATEKTIINFTKKLELDSFATLKKELQGYISTRLTPDEKIFSALQSKPNDNQEVLEKLCESEMHNIRRTIDILNFNDVAAACEVIRNARCVYLISHNISEIVTDFMFYRLRTLGVDVKKFSLLPYESIASQLIHVSKEDVFILCTFPRYGAPIVPMTEYLHSKNIPIISITDSLSSRIAKNSVYTFPCSTDTPVFFNAYSSPIMVANLILSAMVLGMEDEISQQKLQIKEVKQELDGYFSEQAYIVR